MHVRHCLLKPPQPPLGVLLHARVPSQAGQVSRGVRFSNHPEPYTDRPAAELCIINTHTRQETSKYGPACSFQSERDCARAGEKQHCFNSSGVTESSLTAAPTFVFLWKLRCGRGEMRSVLRPIGSVAINRVSLQTVSASQGEALHWSHAKGWSIFPAAAISGLIWRCPSATQDGTHTPIEIGQWVFPSVLFS